MNLPCAVARACFSDSIGRNSILFHSNKLGESWTARGRDRAFSRVQVHLAFFLEQKVATFLGRLLTVERVTWQVAAGLRGLVYPLFKLFISPRSFAFVAMSPCPFHPTNLNGKRIATIPRC